MIVIVRTCIYVYLPACHLLEEGVVAVIGPASSGTVKGTYPLCEGMHIPQVAPFATDPLLSRSEEDFPYLIKVSIS